MEDLNKLNQKQHKLLLMNRKACNITGVLDVISFDTAEVMLETEQGMLQMKGKDLHVSRLSLDKGELDIDGRIDSLTYTDTTSYQAKGESFLARLFR